MKKFNKILSLLMAFAMVLTMLPASALAVVNKPSDEDTSKYVQGMPSGNRDLMESLRENYPDQADDENVIVDANGMTVTEIKDSDITLNKGNDADMLISNYSEDEIVRVIVVLEGAPLLDQGFTTDEIAENGDEVSYQVSVMHTVQDTMMNNINVLVQSVMPDTYSGKIEARYNYSITMNGVSVEVPYGVIDEIAKLDGVADAYVAPQYNLPEDMTESGTAAPNMVSTKDLAGSALTWNAGYTGAGMRIAIIDTGLDLDHPSFVDDVPVTETSLTVSEIRNVLENLNAYKAYAGLTARSLYYSTKVPYRFNYVDEDLDVTHDYDLQGDHGTHVAGIAAANKIDTTEVVGVAPEAQLIVMKVFGKNGGAYWDDIVAAMEDCFWLNVDAVNMSLGSPGGFTVETDELSQRFIEVMHRVEESDMIASVSAGNSYSAATGNYWYDYLVDAGLASYFPELVPGRNQTKDPANGVVSSPGTFIGSTVVASLENNTTAIDYLIAGDEEYEFTFNDNYTYFTYYMAGETWEYVMIPGYGDVSDYEGLDVEGRIAVVSRGVIDFTSKQINAADAGAVACIVYDNVEGTLFYMQDAGEIPNISISMADGLKLKEIAGADGIGTLKVAPTQMVVENELAGLMSDFSSWGVTPDLRLLPDITSYGGNIYSTYTDGQYGIMSGTSMSAPHIAGMAALVLQYLHGSDYAVLQSEADYHVVAEALLMSTATPVVEANGMLYSPRKQGAGNANIYNAISSPVYLTVDGGKPSVSFGEDPERTGVYGFTFELNNLTDSAQGYYLDAAVLTDQFHEAFYQVTGVKLMGETARELSARVFFYVNDSVVDSRADYNGDGLVSMVDVQKFLDDVNFGRADNMAFDLVEDGVLNTADVQAMYEIAKNVNSTQSDYVVVPANGTASVSVSIKLSNADIQYIEENYPNGIYVEGFVRAYAADESACDLSLPFMGFYGEWNDARVFDTESWYHEGMELPERYPSVLWLDSTYGVAAGGNPYDATLFQFDPDYEGEDYMPVVSPNGDGAHDYFDDIYLSLMRNAKLVEFVWSDAETGEVYETIGAEHVRQSSYQSGYGAIVPFIYSWWFDEEDFYKFTDAQGNTLPNGSEVTLDINFYLDDGDMIMDDSTSVTIRIDSERPELLSFKSDYNEVSGQRKLRFRVSDDQDIAAVALLTRTGSVVDMIKPETIATEDGVYADIVFDVTEMDDEMIVIVGDYGGNEIQIGVKFSDGENHVRKDAFYGYRNMINYNYGGTIYLMDGYNGWHSFDENDAASMLMHTSMYSDAEAVAVAADYVDGYVIGIDANNEIFAAKAGDWTRVPMGTFDLEDAGAVLDMTYDFKNEIMYVLTDEVESGAGGKLAVLDIFTGEITAVAKINMPAKHTGQLLTLAADNDGVLYAISYVNGAEEGNKDTGDLYIVNAGEIASGNVSVTYVGETSYIPDYRQSMTFDHDTNELYWMAYAGPYAEDPATFFQVDKNTGELTAISDVEYDSWMTAIFKPYLDCGDIIPDAELTGINLDKTELALGIGASTYLATTPAPYNASLDGAQWTSSNENVATVKDGVVTAVAEGVATITVTCNGISAEIEVEVFTLVENLIFCDMWTNAAWMSTGAVTPGDAAIIEDAYHGYGFMAAAYFNGSIYAGDYNGNFYRFDPETMQGIQIGSTGSSMLIAMAFNYNDGFMYAIEEARISMWSPAEYYLVRVNLNNGNIERVTKFDNDYTPGFGMAIDPNGNFYAIVANYENVVDEYMDLPTIDLIRWTLEKVNGEYVIDVNACVTGGFEYFEYNSSMVYSVDDKGIYTSDSYGQLYWIDPATMDSEDGLDMVNLGVISGQDMSMNMAMMAIPEVEPEIQEVASIENVKWTEKLLVLEGSTVTASVTVEPWNAYPSIQFAVEDTDIAKVDSDGVITGISAGETELSINVGGTVVTATIVVSESTGFLSGYLIQDIATGSGAVTIDVDDTNPSEILHAEYCAPDFNLSAGAYFNGKLYAYAQDYYGDLDYLYYLLEIDAFTKETRILSRVDYNVRDMAFDYTTGNLYGIADGGTLVGAVVQFDIETGKLTVIADTGRSFASMTIDGEGQMYGIGMDGWLYTIDKETGATMVVGNTGAEVGNWVQSMHYDLDTGNVYWAQMAADMTNSLRLVDLETGISTAIGCIGEMGAQMVMLYTIPENEPTEPGETIENGIFITERATTHVGGTVQLDATITDKTELKPGDASADSVGTLTDATIKWTSSDPSIATVDRNGLVTGVAAGAVTITAQVGQYTDTCSVVITAEARRYYAYDYTHNQWISVDNEQIESGDVKVEHVYGEETTRLEATYFAQDHDTIYAIDANGTVYSISPDTFIRTEIASVEMIQSATAYEYDYWSGESVEFEIELATRVVDVAYENGLMYVLLFGEDDYYYVSQAFIVEVNLKTGASAVVFQSSEITPSAIYVKNDRALMIDYFDSDTIKSVDLNSTALELIYVTMIKDLWGERWAGTALFEDALTGTIYGIRDKSDTDAGYYLEDDEGNYIYDEDRNPIWVSTWDGLTGDSVLCIVGLADGSLIYLGEIGEDIIVRGMYLR